MAELSLVEESQIIKKLAQCPCMCTFAVVLSSRAIDMKLQAERRAHKFTIESGNEAASMP